MFSFPFSRFFLLTDITFTSQTLQTDEGLIACRARRRRRNQDAVDGTFDSEGTRASEMGSTTFEITPFWFFFAANVSLCKLNQAAAYAKTTSPKPVRYGPIRRLYYRGDRDSSMDEGKRMHQIIVALQLHSPLHLPPVLHVRPSKIRFHRALS
ncbi:hypothetical protein PM082_018451 [Marasmius tenuissimus]|nr:hypothetical protein PM082_018451 [Marasmius tenuissimus]